MSLPGYGNDTAIPYHAADDSYSNSSTKIKTNTPLLRKRIFFPYMIIDSPLSKRKTGRCQEYMAFYQWIDD